MNNFVSESALEEKRRLRQEEWDKVRKPEDPAGKLMTFCSNSLTHSKLIQNLYFKNHLTKQLHQRSLMTQDLFMTD